MKWLRGYLRLSLAGTFLLFGGILIILSAWLPLTIRGMRLTMWLLKLVVRSLLFALNVKVVCAEPEKLRNFQGFIFPNHVSYVDVLALLSITPVRFLAKAEVRSWPIIGRIGQAIGCVFVKRDDKQSRAEARMALAVVDLFPPVVLFPEGKRGPGGEILPFRYGAFEIVIEGNRPFLPCIILYDHLEAAIWRRGENVLKAIWRLARHPGAVQAQIIPLSPIQPTVADDPVHLSVATHTAITAVFQQNQPT
jgi:1-acyl-sn-glycerol-3-phosphate acyltransferase